MFVYFIQGGFSLKLNECAEFIYQKNKVKDINPRTTV